LTKVILTLYEPTKVVKNEISHPFGRKREKKKKRNGRANKGRRNYTDGYVFTYMYNVRLHVKVVCV
jgi:hypothetical protein